MWVVVVYLKRDGIKTVSNEAAEQFHCGADFFLKACVNERRLDLLGCFSMTINILGIGRVIFV